MSEENTAQANGSKIFQERVSARFDAIDNRLNSMDVRIEKLEMKQYDTKPIWQQVLNRLDSITLKIDSFDSRFERIDSSFERIDSRFERIDSRFERIDSSFERIDSRFEAIDSRFEAIDSRFEAIDTRFEAIDSRFEALNGQFETINKRFDSIDARFAQQEIDIENGFRGVERKIDVLNQYILDLRADQRYVDSRLEKLEAQLKD